MFLIPQPCLTVWEIPNCQSGMGWGHAREEAKSLTVQMPVSQCLGTSLGTPQFIDAGTGKASISFLYLPFSSSASTWLFPFIPLLPSVHTHLWGHLRWTAEPYTPIDWTQLYDDDDNTYIWQGDSKPKWVDRCLLRSYRTFPLNNSCLSSLTSCWFSKAMENLYHWKPSSGKVGGCWFKSY